MNRSFALASSAIILFAFGCSKSGDNSSVQTDSGEPTTAVSTGSTKPGAVSTTAGKEYAAVQTIFTNSCMPCHGSSRPKAGVDLTTYDAVIKGGKHGPIVKAGDPKGSPLMQYLSGAQKPQMPMNKPPLSDADQKTISDWIQTGAKND